MKKLLFVLAAFVLTFSLAACGEDVAQGDYEPGVYFGATEGNQNTFAVLTVDENGVIVGLLVDTVYLKTEEGGPITWDSRGTIVDGYATTKRSLDGGCGYDMHRSGTYCEAPEGQYMWHEQVNMLTDAVVEAQELPEFPMDGDYMDQEDADAIAGVTVSIDSYVAAIQDVLAQAKK